LLAGSTHRRARSGRIGLSSDGCAPTGSWLILGDEANLVAGGNDGGMLHDLYPRLHPRVFCTAVIIEIRPIGHMLEAGMETGCGEYARRGSTLLEGTAGGAEEVMTLSRQGHRYEVVSAESIGDAYDPGWINSHFSAAAAAEINDGTQPGPPDPDAQARRALGFPPGTKTVEP
jgi:hypothetical protein